MDGMGFSNVSALETSSWKDPILILTSCFGDSSERFLKFPSAEWPKSIKNEVFVGSKNGILFHLLLVTTFAVVRLFFCNSIREFKSSFC